MQPSSPPGWYPDPQTPHALRWFDGFQWTAHVAAASFAEPAGAHPDSATHWLLPTGRSWQAITAGYLGLLSLGIFFLGPVAIGFGVWALFVAQRQGSHGRGRAITGIVGGAIGTLVTLAVLSGG